MREVRPGVWELAATTGRTTDGRPERAYRTVVAGSTGAAARELATFVAEALHAAPAGPKDLRDLTMDEAVSRFLEEHLAGEKGREERTITDYRRLHARWFAPELGRRRVRDIDEAMTDRAFGRMRAAGLSPIPIS